MTFPFARLSDTVAPLAPWIEAHTDGRMQPSAERAMTRLLSLDEPLIEGTLVDRPNRFVITVDFGDDPEPVFLGDPGELAFLEVGSPVLCRPVDDSDRATAYDAIAATLPTGYASLRTALANDLFAAAIERDRLPTFDRFDIGRREPPLGDHGRTDFELVDAHGSRKYVEVKSVTHAEGVTAKFPDRQTARGRRHVDALIDLVGEGVDASLVFVVQRPDIERVAPFRSVDPGFADRLVDAAAAGVEIIAIGTAFDPPTYHLYDPHIPVALN